MDSQHNLYLFNKADVNISFIKIGPVSSGVIRGIDLPSLKIDFITEGSDNDAAINIRLASLSFSGVINIVAQTCQTPDVNVPMGAFDINKTFIRSGNGDQIAGCINPLDQLPAILRC